MRETKMIDCNSHGDNDKKQDVSVEIVSVYESFQ